MNAAQYAPLKRDRQGTEIEPQIRIELTPVAAATVDDFGKTIDPIELVPRNITTLELVELLLKNRPRLHQILRVQSAQAVLLPRLLAIALSGFVLFGVTMSLVLAATGHWPALKSITAWLHAPMFFPLRFAPIQSPSGTFTPWLNGNAFVLIFAYAFGLVAASGICLPSLYFYSLLAGVRMSMLEVVVHAVKSKAISAVVLVGILPIYVALAMGVMIFNVGEPLLYLTMLLGLVLPLIAGLWGTASLYQGFAQLCDTMAPDRVARRECFLRRLVLSWAACYSAVMPVMIYSLWEVFSRA
jgi:hypothetical protein